MSTCDICGTSWDDRLSTHRRGTDCTPPLAEQIKILTDALDKLRASLKNDQDKAVMNEIAVQKILAAMESTSKTLASKIGQIENRLAFRTDLKGKMIPQKP